VTDFGNQVARSLDRQAVRQIVEEVIARKSPILSAVAAIGPTYESINDTAARHGIDHQQIRRAIKQDRLPQEVYTVVGRRIYIHRRNFEDMLLAGGAPFAG
jgi:hypothetical protein